MIRFPQDNNKDPKSAVKSFVIHYNRCRGAHLFLRSSRLHVECRIFTPRLLIVEQHHIGCHTKPSCEHHTDSLAEVEQIGTEETWVDYLDENFWP